MANPFEIRSATPGIMEGFNAFAQQYQSGQDREASQMQQQQDMERRQRTLSEGAEILQSRDPDAIANWSMKNPEYIQIINKVGDIRDDLTTKSQTQMAKDVLIGRIGPREAYEQRRREIQAGGGDTQLTDQMLETKTDDELMESWKTTLSFNEPKAWNAYSKTAGGASPSRSAPTAEMKNYEYYQSLKKSNPEGATQFAMDVGLIPKDKTMSAAGENALIDSQNRFFESSTQAREYELLADDYGDFQETLPVGAAGTFSEFIRSLGGTQNEQSELRRRFAKVRLSEALKYLPPGPATDRDVQEAFKGVPKENASAKQVQMFLRGSAKLAAVDAEFQEFRSNYISENENTKNLIRDWKRAIKDGEVQSISRLDDETTEEKTTIAPQGIQQETTIDTPSGTAAQVDTVAPRNARGWELMTDAQGNKAYVSPDGSQFEEVR